ncbi:MAG: tetratricopeptide repeat protein, partial [Cytophagales bacterium]
CYYSLFQNHQVAQWWLEKAVHTYQKNCGEQHSDTVFARLLLFFVRGFSTSSFEKAKPYFQQAIELSENKFGKNHIRTIGSYNAIGIFLLCSNRLAEAEEYFKKALGCCQTKHIPQSVFALSSYGFLLSIYERQNRDAEFEECLEKCIEISEMIYGKNHIISVRYHRRKNQMAWLKTIESYRRKVTEEKTTTHGE